MDNCVDETDHAIFLGQFENNKRYKEQIVREILAAICAMLNSNGGKVVIHIEADGKDIPVGGTPFSQNSLVIRILEQSMISIIGLYGTISNINFVEDKEVIVIVVKRTNSLITTNYNLYLPSQSQIALVPPCEHQGKVKDDIINRKLVLEPVQIGSHCQIFRKDTICGICESKTVQLKNLEAHATKRTTLADRIIGKGNKFRCYISGYGNYKGGHVYFGIRDDRVVVGEWIASEEDKDEIRKKVEKAVKKTIWPEHIGQPKRGEHWDIFFEPVLDENSKPIPSTFVIVIYIAACLGGVFTEEPECYEIKEGQVKKMSFIAWKKKMLLPAGLCSCKKNPPSVPPITWSSPNIRKAFTVKGEKLRQLIGNGNWNAFEKERQSGEFESDLCEMKLLVLSKNIKACCRKSDFIKAYDFLNEYEIILPRVKDQFIFEVMKLYLEAALKRASGDLKALEELLIAALSKAEQIEPGLVPAIVLVFAATVTDLVFSGDQGKKFSPDVLSIRALDHLHHVPDSSDVLSDMEQKAHMILATFHLGCNMNGQRVRDSIDSSDLDKARDNIKAIHQCADVGSPRPTYFEIQLNLVLSIYNYRLSQLHPDERVRFLRNALNYAEKGERLASELHFTELVKWSKTNKAMCKDE